MLFPCIACGKRVRENQHAVQCETCDQWQHRACNTGISVSEYRLAVDGERDLQFVCEPCQAARVPDVHADDTMEVAPDIDATHSYIRKLLSLPFLPHEHIRPTFQQMREFNTSDALRPLLRYLERHWFGSSVWSVEEWCVFGQAVRTNNDVEGFTYDYVTCGSTLKLFNPYHQVRLHSHDVKYGSGSGQQSVTAVESSDDHNSYWQVKAKTGTQCIRGQPIKCGQTIRLMHLSTRRNLHSHHFQSPLSHNLEVSAFGEDGEGDEGDNWSIVCTGKYWNRKDKVRIKNVVTEHYLHVSGDTFGRPIKGQREVSGYGHPTELNYWQAMEGIYVTPSEDPKGTFRGELPVHHNVHTEL